MSQISKEEAISICKKCKSWGIKGCLAIDIEGSRDEYVVIQPCMEAEINSPPEKIVQHHKPIETEGDTLDVPRSIDIPDILKTRGVDTKKAGNWFVRHPDYHVTPLALSEFCHISHESAKKICTRFYERGLIQQSLKDHYEYQQKLTASDLETMTKMENIKIHDIRMKTPIPSGDKPHLTPSRGTMKESSGSEGKSNSGRNLTSTWGTEEYFGESRSKKKPEKIIEMNDNQGNHQAIIKITRYNTEFEITISCSKNPLDILAVERVMGIIEGAGYSLVEAYFYLVEVNVDIPGLEMNGAQSIKLTDFKNCIQRYYNKKGKLRKEFILRGNIPLEEVLAVMRGEQVLGTNVLGNEFEKTKKELEKVKEHLKKSNDNYRQVLIKIDNIESKGDKKLRLENQELRKQLLESQKTEQVNAGSGAVKDIMYR